ncbi:DUF6308 family protein [Mycolicibacter longobardus]|uniref:Uncharacterized protein n=1 Tax=Mycolicibacter longobardus TaxID=1108812 RepID=A0A1X1YKE1_9MYCO|nr:DUF6308 family protein [Mycolicibacter longobardus]MCV7383916.1 hypothetical protein [Mycolicibacter longobardus]ORW11524.1 hypothetical protein AWC16_10525 [Mycolicibacter longobardus]
MIRHTALRMPSVLQEEFADQAVELLRQYQRYSGWHFETLGHPWNDPATINTVTAADLLALNTLSVQGSAWASIEILDTDLGREFAELLKQISPNLDLVDATDADLGEGSPADRLWKLCRPNGTARWKHFGPVTTSKLLARKRPRLVPIYDSVVGDQYGLKDSRGLWFGMREALLADNRRLHNHAVRLHRAAGLPETVTPLRVIDIVVWMYGKASSF